MRIVLASASPRRSHLMAEYGYDFSIQPADVEEVSPPHLTVAEITLFNAKRKALAIAEINRDATVIGVDTLVALDGATLGKPRDMDEAFDMLTRLSGRIHEVYSGVWIVHMDSNTNRIFVEVSRVKFRALNEQEIHRYMARIHPLDKAGAYAAQDDGPDGVIEQIEGSRTNVVGLPMDALARALGKFGKNLDHRALTPGRENLVAD